MYCNCICEVYFFKHFARIFYHPVIHPDCHRFEFGVDLFNYAHVAVEHALSFRKEIICVPFSAVIVAQLHHLVAFTEDNTSYSQFYFIV